MNFKTGDKVVVIAGKDKGKDGKITKIFRDENKIIVENVNMIKKHRKSNGQTPGSIVEMESPIHASNAMIVDPKTKTRSRIGHSVDKKRQKKWESVKNQMSQLTNWKEDFMNRLQEKYNKEIIPVLMEKFGYKSVMQSPKLDKIVINIGVGDATNNSKLLDAAVADLTAISGQKPVITKAKKAIAGFKLREGQAIGCKVTLRGENMYNFLDKLVSITLPRVRDFRGISPKAFDGRGNYTLGLTEQLIFSEIEYDNVVKVRGMDVVFVTTAKTNDEAFELLKGFGMPFKN